MVVESFTPAQVNITPAAIEQLESILDGMGDQAVNVAGLRVFVHGGGCSGFQYGFSFAQTKDLAEDDAVFDHGKVKILVDPLSFQYLVGATVDYESDVYGSQFKIQNPNATNTCGCGKSFTA